MSDSPIFDLTTLAGQKAHYAASRKRILNAKPKLREDGYKRRSEPFIPPEARYSWARSSQLRGPFAPMCNPWLAPNFAPPPDGPPPDSPPADPPPADPPPADPPRADPPPADPPPADPSHPDAPTVAAIIKFVCHRYNISMVDIASIRRQQSLALIRHIAMYLCRTLTPCSTPQIARGFGDRDHSTILHAVAKIKGRIEQDEAFAAEIEGLKRELMLGADEAKRIIGETVRHLE